MAGGTKYYVLVGIGNVGFRAFKQEAEQRFTQHHNRAGPPRTDCTAERSPAFLIAGSIDRITQPAGQQADILDTMDSLDLIESASSDMPNYVFVEDVLYG